MNNKLGIYKIECLINDKIYIGSGDVQARLTWHKSHLKNNTHYKKDMQDDFNLYGIENFLFEVIEYIEEDKLSELENTYINKFKCVEYGYNSIKGVNGRYKKTNEHKKKLSKPRIFTQEHKKHLKDSWKPNNYGIKVKCIETNTIYNSIAQASKETNTSYDIILRQINNKYKRKHKTKILHFVRI